jgi:hypothetical protein
VQLSVVQFVRIMKNDFLLQVHDSDIRVFRFLSFINAALFLCCEVLNSLAEDFFSVGTYCTIQ